MVKVLNHRTGQFLFLALFLFGSCWLWTGCKDTKATHEAGILESCKLLLNDRDWKEAINVCGDLDSDEGKHLTAIAYMGRSGLLISSILVELTDSSNSPSTLIFNYIPDTTAKVSDFKAALRILMDDISVKDQSIYLEGILLSSLLIFKELKTLLGLSLVNGEIGTCAGDPADISNCDFAPSITEVYSSTYGYDVPGTLSFGGLGSAFYQGVCSDLTSDAAVTVSKTDTATEIALSLVGDPDYGTIDVDVTYDVTIDSAPVQAGSALYYNKIASEAYAVSGTQDLSSLNFYSRMDSGTNFSVDVSPLPTVTFCNSGAIEPPDASDDVLSDCEILSFLENPGF